MDGLQPAMVDVAFLELDVPARSFQRSLGEQQTTKFAYTFAVARPNDHISPWFG